MTRQELIDWTTRWGVFLVGVCLLLGLFSRTACLAGAGFLLMFYLSMPPLPGLPDNPRAEGTYLYINKNFIEMLALLTLATTASGRWVGLDGLLYCLNPFRWGRSEPSPKSVSKDGDPRISPGEKNPWCRRPRRRLPQSIWAAIPRDPTWPPNRRPRRRR